MQRKTKKNKSIHIGVIDKETVFNSKKERFNAHQGGYGAFKDKTKYSRKQKWGNKYEE